MDHRKSNKLICYLVVLLASLMLHVLHAQELSKHSMNMAADQIQSRGKTDVSNSDEVPYIARRGIKYNITLDRRTPSYDSGGDAAANAVAHNWDMSFWTEFIDKLASYKYNVLTLWNLNPFPSLVITPGFEHLALNDVQDMSGRVILNWTIQQKIQFWKEVMAYAKSKGFEIYIFNWNIKTNGTNLPDTDNASTREYLRNSLYALFETYPDLDGFGLHSGENMGGFPDDAAKEAWLYDVFGQAFENFKQDHPDRQLRFIHRLWESELPDIMPYWGNLSYPMDVSIKYSRAHLYSYPAPTYFVTDGTKSDLDRYHKKTWLNLRNDDIFYYRWGDPDYVREYIKNLPDPDKYTAGFYIGSDGYEWNRVFSSKNPLFQGDLEINKHWYSTMLWGQLAYDPDTPDQVFVDSIAAHFPGVNAQALFDAWRYASKIFPKVSSAIFWPWDFQWYVEGCYSYRGFRTVDDFINTSPMDGAPIYSIKEYVLRLKAGLPMEKETPLQVSHALHAWADSALALTELIDGGGNTELMLTLNDIKAMSWMGYYYSDKIAGAVYKQMGDMGKFADHILAAYCHWNKVAEIASAQYYDQTFSRLSNQKFSWNNLKDDVAGDLGIGNITNYCDAENPPNPPAELNATFIKKDNVIQLTWTDNADNENLFKIERSAADDTVFSVINIVAANVTSYEDRAIIGNTIYHYRICATNPAGDSQYSNVDTAKTAEIQSGQIPWVEDFDDLVDGTTADYGPTQWSVNTSAMGNLSGTFSVQNHRFDVSDTDGNGIWISEKIDISSAPAVQLSIKVSSIGGLDESGSNYDYVRCYIKVDDGPETLITELKGKIYNNSPAGTIITKENISGETLQIFLHSSTSYNDEHYYFDDISVKATTTDIGKGSGRLNLPRHFELKQNYPNPFNAVTSIPFSLPKKSAVSIKIYTIDGGLVSEILNDVKNAGQYSILWDAGKYSSGTYLINMKAGNFETMKKCVLIK